MPAKVKASQEIASRYGYCAVMLSGLGQPHLFPVRPGTSTRLLTLAACKPKSDSAPLGDASPALVYQCSNSFDATLLRSPERGPFQTAVDWRNGLGLRRRTNGWDAASVVFAEVECVEFDEAAGLGVTAGSGTAYTRSGPTVATEAARRRCAKISISGQIWITAKAEIAPTAMAPAILARMSRMGEK